MCWQTVLNLLGQSENPNRLIGSVYNEQRALSRAINEFIQEEALAYELAAKHYLARGREKFAQLYMKEAHYCYERWGVMSKVKDLESRYPQFFPQSSSAVSTPIHKSSGTLSNRSNTAFDLATVMKASQTISREIELDQLLHSRYAGSSVYRHSGSGRSCQPGVNG